MIEACLKDGFGSGKKLKINGEGELGVVVHTHPPIDEVHPSIPFRQYFTVDGSTTGNFDMRVNGSINPVEFFIKQQDDEDLYIKTLNIELAGSGARFDRFGNLPALTKGLQLIYKSNQVGELLIHEGIKDNITFFRLSGQTPAITDLSGGGADSVQITIDMAKTFGAPFGIRIKKGTEDKLILKVNDDLSATLDSFNAFGYGVTV